MTQVHDAERLKELQALPLERKIQITQTRIIEWYQHYNGNVCVSFSGGKDSTVLLHIARKIYPNIPAVFSNTGLEYSSIQRFVKTWDNVDIITPEMRFDEVVSTYGYPLIGKEVAQAIYYARRIYLQNTGGSAIFGRNELMGKRAERQFNKEKWFPLVYTPFMISHYCCYKMKKLPMKRYQHEKGYRPILATLASESVRRKSAWIRSGCNAFDSKDPKSQPLSFWTEQDVLAYLVRYSIPIASAYGEIVSVGHDGNLKCTGCQRTGCSFCAFGLHMEKGKTRFHVLAEIEPRKYEYALDGGQWVDNPHYDPAAPKMDGDWQNWNPKKIWVPSKKGLGMGKVFDMVNEIYGTKFYRYD